MISFLFLLLMLSFQEINGSHFCNSFAIPYRTPTKLMTPPTPLENCGHFIMLQFSAEVDKTIVSFTVL